jgi:hypothetical protein
MGRNICRVTRLLLMHAICLLGLGAVVCAQAGRLCDRAKDRSEDACRPAALLNVNSPDSFSISKYVIQGVVMDDQGAPVEGAALHIGRLLAHTDSSGRFMLRLSKRGSFPFSIATEEFIANGVYQVISAPSEVHSESEENVTDVQVVVRRLPSPQAKLYRQ